ncbi:MAG: Gfo/Idh/MocA family oxidoreductase [Caldilineaceae bacterium]|nr:Gfo/Idh/MocA family oxidoreductase [Caldilineaceae bacterium]
MTEKKDKIRVAQVGFGYWGPNLARNLYQMPNVDLAYLVDKDETVFPRVRELYPGTATVTDLSAVVDDADLDAIVIATPARSHYSLAKTALLADKHLFVEKPLAMDLTHARELVDLARERQRVLMVGHIFEYNSAVRYIKAALDRGDLGEVYYLYSRRVNLGRVQSDINALWSIAPHDISIALYLLGRMPEAVSCHGSACLNGAVEDVIFLTLHFSGPILCHVHASWLDPSKQREMTIVGSEKMVVYNDVASEDTIRIYDKGVYRRGDPIYGEYQFKVHSGDILVPRLDMREPLREELNDFARAIQTGTPPQVDGENGLRVVTVLAAGQRSLEQNGVKVEIASLR